MPGVLEVPQGSQPAVLHLCKQAQHVSAEKTISQHEQKVSYVMALHVKDIK